ncbi:MAG TPA: cytochrome c [Terriglobales bacterium]|nr:cytochrome c [Terriglobales bacterium]
MRALLRLPFALIVLALFCSPTVLADGGQEFKVKCAPCHGARGGGETKLGQHLRVRDMGSADVQKLSDAEMTDIIRKGRGKMPSYEGKLKREQIEELVRFIRTLKK